MFRLRTFGPLTLSDERGEVLPAATQRRRLALLAIIANAGRAGIARSKAALLLWPESDAESASHSLSQLLYSIKQTLAIEAGGGPSANLRLDSTQITSDVGEFDAALKANDSEKAAKVYSGPFLDGFSLPDASEFDRWIDSERNRRARQASSAIEQLATDAAANGLVAEAADWWKKLAAIDPLDSRIAVSLMKALDSAGNRPGAVKHARIHAALVRDELGIEPDSVVLAYAQRLQTEPSREAKRSEGHFENSLLRTSTLRPFATNGATEKVESEVGVANALPATQITESRLSVSTKQQTSLLRRRSGPAGAFIILVFAALAIYVSNFRRERTMVVAPATIAVLPFVVHGDPSVAYLGEGLVDLLSTSLDGAGDLRAVDPRSLLSFITRTAIAKADPARAATIANHFRADLFVTGDITESGGRLHIASALYSVRNLRSPLASAVVEGDRTSLVELIDSVAVKLLAGRYQGSRERLMRTAAVTTHSLAALKFYLQGEQDLRAGRFDKAINAFTHAVTLDSTFALAYYRMSIAAEWQAMPQLQSTAAQSAIRFSNRLSSHDRQLVEALSARRRRNPDRAELLYRRIVAEFPDDVEAWYQLGEVLFHENSSRGRSFIESRYAWEHVLALVPNDKDALLHLIRVLARTDSRAIFDSTIAVTLPGLTPEQRVETQAFHAFTVGTMEEQDAAITRLKTASAEIIWQALWRVAVYGRNLEGAKVLAGVLAEPDRSLSARARGHEALMLLLLAQGQRSAGVAEGAKVIRRYPWSADVGHIYFQSLGYVKNSPEALRQLRLSFDNWIPPTVADSQLFNNPQGVLAPHFKAYSAGLLSLALRETTTARKYATQLEILPAPAAVQNLPRMLAMVLRAGALQKEGRSSEALTLLEDWNGGEPIELSAAMGIEPYYGWMRAELLRDTGRDSEALRWYESRVDLFVSEVIYLAPAALRAAEIYDRRGEAAKAMENYRLFIKLWGGADPELQPLITKARERLAVLGSFPQSK